MLFCLDGWYFLHRTQSFCNKKILDWDILIRWTALNDRLISSLNPLLKWTVSWIVTCYFFGHLCLNPDLRIQFDPVRIFRFGLYMHCLFLFIWIFFVIRLWLFWILENRSWHWTLSTYWYIPKHHCGDCFWFSICRQNYHYHVASH